ncbi:MAG: LptF/LptG family permease [Blastocatellia bacterium]
MPTVTRFSFRLFRYVLLEALPFIALTLLVLTMLILAQQVAKQSELLFSSTATLMLSLRLILSLLPSVLIVTLPFSLLIGTLMTLNRLASDSEIIAMQASGISILRLSLPLITCGALGMGASLYLTLSLLPQLVADTKVMRQDLLLRALTAPIKPQTFDTHFPNLLLYVREIEAATGDWRGVFLVRKTATQPPPVPVASTNAPGTTVVLTANRARLRMTQAAPITLELELLDGILVTISDPSPERESATRFSQQSIKLSAADTPALAQSLERGAPELSLSELQKRGSAADSPLERRQALVEWHKRFALPLACLILVLIAIPLGSVSTRMAGRTVAFALGFGLAVLYYLILLAGQNLALSGVLPAEVGIWLPNSLGLFGCLAVHLNALSLPSRRSLSPKASPHKTLLKNTHLSNRFQFSLAPLFPSLATYLLLSEMTKYLLLSSLILVITSLVFTLFDLLPALSRSQLGVRYAAIYLAYLAPQIFYYIAPFAVLLALLISHGILARSNQITALMVGGQSPLRLALPFLLCAAGTLVALFLISENVLPTSNREQDARYNRIKGKPAEQATLAFGQRWTQGENGTIYAYQYNNETNKLLNTTAYQVSSTGGVLRSILQANETSPLSPQTWQVQQGWQILIQEMHISFIPISPAQTAQLTVPDGNQIFSRVINEATKMSFFELRQYIRYLSRLQAPVTSLRVDLEKKLAFPFACLPLIAVAFPLALRNSKRRALAGIGLSIIIGLTYWISASLFESLGRQAFLPPGLSVWGPQALFLTLGIFLSFRLR